MYAFMTPRLKHEASRGYTGTVTVEAWSVCLCLLDASVNCGGPNLPNGKGHLGGSYLGGTSHTPARGRYFQRTDGQTKPALAAAGS